MLSIFKKKYSFNKIIFSTLMMLCFPFGRTLYLSTLKKVRYNVVIVFVLYCKHFSATEVKLGHVWWDG